MAAWGTDDVLLDEEAPAAGGLPRRAAEPSTEDRPRRAALRLLGHAVADRSGTPFAVVEHVLVDRQSGVPRWLQVRLHDVPLSRAVPVPLDGPCGGVVTVPYDQATVRRSPPVPADGGLTARLEAELCHVFRITRTRGAALSPDERRRTTAVLEDVGDTVRWRPSPRLMEDRRQAGGTPPGAERRRGRPVCAVAIVSGEPDLRSVLAGVFEATRTLEPRVVVGSAAEALPALRTADVDLLVLDAHLEDSAPEALLDAVTAAGARMRLVRIARDDLLPRPTREGEVVVPRAAGALSIATATERLALELAAGR